MKLLEKQPSHPKRANSRERNTTLVVKLCSLFFFFCHGNRNTGIKAQLVNEKGEAAPSCANHVLP